METKTSSMCKNEKHIEFYNKFAECTVCNCKRGLKRCYDNKEKILNERKLYSEKNTAKMLFKQILDIYISKIYLDPMLCLITK